MNSYSSDKYLLSIVTTFGPRSFPLPGQAWNGNHITTKDWLKAGSYERLCNDPRDRVFGLWGCFSQDIRNSIVVDYSQDYEMVFTQFFRTLIENTRSLNPLLDSCARSWKEAKDLDDWRGPSWVRRFNFPNSEFDHNLKGRSAFGSLPTYFRFSNESQFLHTKGIQIGTVGQCSKFFPLTAKLRQSDILELARHIQTASQELNVPKESTDLFINSCTGLPEKSELRSFVRAALSKQFKGTQDLSINDWQEVLILLGRALGNQHIFSFSHHPCQTKQKGKALQPVNHGYGTGTYDIQQNDLLVILLGCSVPLVLRPRGDHKVLVGKAIIPGYMEGEGVKGIKVREDADGNTNFEGAEDFVLC